MPQLPLVAQHKLAYPSGMARSSYKHLFPASFYGRAVLILIVPIIVIQIVLSVVFIQRHYERVTTQLTTNTAHSLHVLVDRLEQNPDADAVLAELADLVNALNIGIALPAPLPPENIGSDMLDLAAGEVLRTLNTEFPQILRSDLSREAGNISIWLQTRHGVLELHLPRALVTTSNPHQLLVIVFLASALMTLIAFQFLRLQVRPIRRLGAAAEAYGRGERVAFRASGAREIRAAALAFIDMRNRLERQRTQQQIMLSGVSHDMRTPLTRMRLILSMMDDSEETAALETEIIDLETRLERFLDYTRGQMTETGQLIDPDALIFDLVERYRTAGHEIGLFLAKPAPPDMFLQAGALGRALDNLISNALRHGTRVEVSRDTHKGWLRITVEDNGPGIPEDERNRACDPFVRLDAARNSESGGVGLGLAIVTEAARAHAGALELDDSPNLGGLRARLLLPLKGADQIKADKER